MTHSNIGARLAAARQSKALSQRDVARRAGVALHTVRNYEHERRRDPRTRARIAEAIGLELTVRELVAE